MASTTTSKEETRSVIKFCALSGQTPADTLNQISKVYGDNSVCRTLVFDWHKRFREGWRSIEDNERSGRPISKHSEQAVEEVRALLKEDRRYTLKDLALATGFSVWKMHQIVHEDLGMRRVCARWIPRLLTAEHPVTRHSLQWMCFSGLTSILLTVQRSHLIWLRVTMLFSQDSKHSCVGYRFNNEEDLRRAVTDFVASIPAQEFKNIFVKWCERWRKCIQCKGEYFEKE